MGICTWRSLKKILEYPIKFIIGHLSERKTMKTFLYFAYGSNMSERRLRDRVPSAKVIGTGVLHNYCLTFHKLSKKDGSGKCTIECSESDKVYGVLFKIDKAEECKLDEVEGKGYGYKEIPVNIKIWDTGKTICGVKTYQATSASINSELKPYSWYKQHVFVGAIEQKLPPWYIDCLIRIPACKDPCKRCEERELSIYD